MIEIIDSLPFHTKVANFTVVPVIILVLFLLPYTLFYFLYDLSFVGVMTAAPKYGVGSEYRKGKAKNMFMAHV